MLFMSNKYSFLGIVLIFKNGFEINRKIRNRQPQSKKYFYDGFFCECSKSEDCKEICEDSGLCLLNMSDLFGIKNSW